MPLDNAGGEKWQSRSAPRHNRKRSNTNEDAEGSSHQGTNEDAANPKRSQSTGDVNRETLAAIGSFKDACHQLAQPHLNQWSGLDLRLPTMKQENDVDIIQQVRAQREKSKEIEEESGPKLQVYQWIILISLNTIGPFSSDAYVPNLGNIQHDLKTTDQLASLTIQINWIVLGLFNPIIGGYSDKYGRKRVIVFALGLYILGALGSAMAPSIEWLIFARIIQGSGEAVSVITSAVIRDVVDDMKERMRLQAFFGTLRPLMILLAPTIGGAFGTFATWRQLFYGLAAWGVMTLFLVIFCIPESKQAPAKGKTTTASKNKIGSKGSGKGAREIKISVKQTREEGGDELEAPLLDGDGGGDEVDESELSLSELSLWEKLGVLFSNHDWFALTITAALFMGAVRSMLSNISFVYEHYYNCNTLITGILISVPTICGFGTSMYAAGISRKMDPGILMRRGMAVGVLAPTAMLLSAMFVYWRGWWATVIPCAIMAAAGFFTLPAMQVLVLQDFKEISGLAAGVSKLIMTVGSTGFSMFVSWYFTTATHSTPYLEGHYCPADMQFPTRHGGQHAGVICFDTEAYAKAGKGPCNSWCTKDATVTADAGCPLELCHGHSFEEPHYHTQRLLLSLGVLLAVCQIWFWLGYVVIMGPTKRPQEKSAHK
jgi:MFS family permease